MKAKATIFMLFVVLLGCRKDTGPNVILNGALTDCTANSTCAYNYYDNAGFTSGNQFINGSYRVFWYKSTNVNACGPTSQFYFKTPMNYDTFDINSDQIAAGQIVAYDHALPLLLRR